MLVGLRLVNLDCRSKRCDLGVGRSERGYLCGSRSEGCNLGVGRSERCYFRL